MVDQINRGNSIFTVSWHLLETHTVNLPKLTYFYSNNTLKQQLETRGLSDGSRWIKWRIIEKLKTHKFKSETKQKNKTLTKRD